MEIPDGTHGFGAHQRGMRSRVSLLGGIVPDVPRFQNHSLDHRSLVGVQILHKGDELLNVRVAFSLGVMVGQRILYSQPCSESLPESEKASTSFASQQATGRSHQMPIVMESLMLTEARLHLYSLQFESESLH